MIVVQTFKGIFKKEREFLELLLLDQLCLILFPWKETEGKSDHPLRGFKSKNGGLSLVPSLKLLLRIVSFNGGI